MISHGFPILKGPLLPFPGRWPPGAALPAAAPAGAALVPREAAHAGAPQAVDVGRFGQGKSMGKMWEKYGKYGRFLGVCWGIFWFP